MAESQTIGVFGAGWVGLVTGGCLADLGHDVVVRDVLPERIDALEAGRLPFHEPGLPEVLERNRERIRYTLDYRYEEPHLVAWRYVEGDVRNVDGELVLEDVGDGTTLATYALRLDPGVWLPERISGMLSSNVMHGVLEDLKQRVEGATA